ncbi:MAG: hypothetical protein AAF388_12355 [Bacteroidota bacterium]
MKNCICLILLLSGILFSSVFSQETDDNLLIPSVSAFTVGKGEMALNIFGGFSYDAQVFNLVSPPFRFLDADFNTTNLNLQTTLGVSANNNFNIGVDVNQVRTWESGNADNSASLLKVGPRLRWRPLGELGATFDLVMQNSILFKLADTENLQEGEPEIRTQLIASKFIRPENASFDLILQASADLIIQPTSSVPGLDEKRPITTAYSFLVGLAPNENWLVFSSVNYSLESANLPWVETDEYFLRRSATSLSAGLQFILARKYSLFFAHNFLLNDVRGGGADSASIGLRLLFLKQYE